MMLRFAAPLLGCLAASLVVSNSVAQTVPVPSQSGDGCTVLEAREAELKGNAQAMVLLGLCREEVGNVSGAIRAYEAALVLTPDAHLVRARLAAMYVLSGEAERGRGELVRALARVPAQPASETGALQTAAIDTVQGPLPPPAPLPPYLSNGEISVSRYYDSNVNAGTSADSITGVIGGVALPFTISPGSKPQADSGTRVNGTAQIIRPLDQHFGIVASGGFELRFNDELTNLNRQALNLAAGVIYADTDLAWRVTPVLQLGFEAGTARQVRVGVEGNVQRPLNEQTTWFGGVSVTRAWDPVRDRSSAWDVSTSTGFSYQLNSDLEISLMLAGRRVSAEQNADSYWSVGPQLGFSALLTDNVELGLGYGVQFASYDQIVGIFPQGRQDTRHFFSAELNLDLSKHVAEGVGARFGYEFQHTQSAVDLYDIDRHVVSAGLRYSF